MSEIIKIPGKLAEEACNKGKVFIRFHQIYLIKVVLMSELQDSVRRPVIQFQLYTHGVGEAWFAWAIYRCACLPARTRGATRAAAFILAGTTASCGDPFHFSPGQGILNTCEIQFLYFHKISPVHSILHIPHLAWSSYHRQICHQKPYKYEKLVQYWQTGNRMYQKGDSINNLVKKIDYIALLYPAALTLHKGCKTSREYPLVSLLQFCIFVWTSQNCW